MIKYEEVTEEGTSKRVVVQCHCGEAHLATNEDGPIGHVRCSCGQSFSYDFDAREVNAPTVDHNDKGHVALVTDLTRLLDAASHFEFHDAKPFSTQGESPKELLVAYLDAIADRLGEGKYGND